MLAPSNMHTSPCMPCLERCRRVVVVALQRVSASRCFTYDHMQWYQLHQMAFIAASVWYPAHAPMRARACSHACTCLHARISKSALYACMPPKTACARCSKVLVFSDEFEGPRNFKPKGDSKWQVGAWRARARAGRAGGREGRGSQPRHAGNAEQVRRGTVGRPARCCMLRSNMYAIPWACPSPSLPQALNLHYDVNGDVAAFRDSSVTVEGGSAVITVTRESVEAPVSGRYGDRDVTLPYKSGMLQGWNKVRTHDVLVLCFGDSLVRSARAAQATRRRAMCFACERACMRKHASPMNAHEHSAWLEEEPCACLACLAWPAHTGRTGLRPAGVYRF